MNILEYENYHEGKDHGQPDFPYNTYLCTIPLDFPEVPVHWQDEIELIYVKKGRGIISVDFQEYTVASPAIVLILPGQLHALFQYKQESMEYENIIFHPDMLLTKKSDICSASFILPLLHGQISVPTIFTPAFSFYADIAAPIDSCDEICRVKPQGYELYIKGQLYQFLYILNSRCQDLSIPPKDRRSLDKMKPILKYMENHYMEKITIAEIADVAGFSQSHFMRYFKETMGTTFIDYLRDYRLTMAARLLAASESAILAVSEEVGFDNLSYFNRAFKKKYKMTPREYRRCRF